MTLTALTEVLEAVISKKASMRFKVKGFSMSPFIKNDDVVTISPVDIFPIGIGRPVAFRHPISNKLVIHRIVGGKGDNYIIKGDRINCIDGLVSKKYILGVVTGVERNKKRIFSGIGPERFIIAVLSRWYLLRPLLICLSMFSRPFKKHRSK